MGAMRGPRITLIALLTFALAGGAQACMAVCAQPHKGGAVPSQSERACSKCHGKQSTETPATPKPAEPCQHCKAGPADRLADRVDSPITPLLATALLPPAIAPVAPHTALSVTTLPVLDSAPPNDVLHVVCVLLI
jgi:hypothetical protein